MALVKIYALINPINRKPFYVGATIHNLKTRLSGHISEVKNKTLSLDYKLPKKIMIGNIRFHRQSTILSIIAKGKSVKIKLLREVPLKDAGFFERYYYQLFTDQGIIIFQSPRHTNYTQKMLTEIEGRKWLLTKVQNERTRKDLKLNEKYFNLNIKQ